MSEVAAVKSKLEAARQQKAAGATQAEARGAVQEWAAIVNHPEASQSLKSIATLRRRELEAAVVIESAAARELALANLSAIAAQFLP